MRNNLIDEMGAYKTMNFKSKKTDSIWRLTSSESIGRVMDTLDTFTNGQGDFITYKRSEVDKQVELGNITAA